MNRETRISPTDSARLEDLYRSVRDKLKCGKLNGFNKAHIKEIDRLIGAKSSKCKFDEGSLQLAFFQLQSHLKLLAGARGKRVADSPLYLKSLSVSLEFRDYLEELPYEHFQVLTVYAETFLNEFNGGGDLKVATYNERVLLKEKARLISIYANQLRRQHRYEEAARAVKSAIHVVVDVLRPRGMQCNTVLGGLYYVESKLLRDAGDLRGSEKKLTAAIECYSAWVTEKENGDNPKNVQLAYYKIAIFLGSIAWSKNSRGLRTDALTLINVARLLILPTEWEMDKAHFDLIYADVERAFLGSEQLGKAIIIADHSYSTFKRHHHNRMMSRAAYTSALLSFYANDLYPAEAKLNEVEDFSTVSGDIKWLINCWTLRARIKNKQREASEALSWATMAIDAAFDAKLMNQRIVAHIVKSEAECLLGDYAEAMESLYEAGRLNERRIGAGIEVSSERNRGWILLSLANAHLLNNDLGKAKHLLDEWKGLDSVEVKWLDEIASGIQQALDERLPKDFVIERGTDTLSWRKRQNALAAWLINQAELHTGSKENEVIAKALGISTRRLGQLRKDLEDDSTAPGIHFPRRSKKRR